MQSWSTQASSSSTQVAQARTAAIAAALAAPCENSQLTPDAGNLDLARAAVLCLINKERARNGEAPVVVDPHLQAAAQGHAEDMISADYFEHVSPTGVTPGDRVRANGYIPSNEVGYVIGENIAWGTLSLATPQAIVSAWMASPGHRANVLESRYADTGIAIDPAAPASLAHGDTGATYVQEFGVIES